MNKFEEYSLNDNIWDVFNQVHNEKIQTDNANLKSNQTQFKQQNKSELKNTFIGNKKNGNINVNIYDEYNQNNQNNQNNENKYDNEYDSSLYTTVIKEDCSSNTPQCTNCPNVDLVQTDGLYVCPQCCLVIDNVIDETPPIEILEPKLASE